MMPVFYSFLQMMAEFNLFFV